MVAILRCAAQVTVLLADELYAMRIILFDNVTQWDILETSIAVISHLMIYEEGGGRSPKVLGFEVASGPIITRP